MFFCKDNEEQRKRQRAESPAFIVTYIILIVTIVIQLFVFNMYITSIMGEFIAMVIGGTWATVGYIRQDLWKLKGATLYLLFLYGFIFAFAFSLISPVAVFIKDSVEFKVCFILFMKYFCVLFPTCIIVTLLICIAVKYKNAKYETKK
ncbi:DUF6773 family protein [Mediterraneibacter agrestimuris]|uniref:DUF6773 family protein n=1 Tax=Mediterraneibacter agrestimuris TaxID=2941333 RepID=UPI00203F1212|nr:DUF6773 family protein [Mediterraneibacter agrestimuris]